MVQVQSVKPIGRVAVWGAPDCLSGKAGSSPVTIAKISWVLRVEISTQKQITTSNCFTKFPYVPCVQKGFRVDCIIWVDSSNYGPLAQR